MAELANPRHERFCQLFIALGNASEAYRQSGGKGRNADVMANQLMVTNGIKPRINELRAEIHRKNALNREEALSFLADAIRTPADDVPKKSWLIQSCKRTICDGVETVEIKMPDKTVCLQILNRMLGWDQPSRVALSADDTLTSYLLSLRAMPIGGTVLELEEGTAE